ncbi:MAG: TraB family protein [DPANN group archaeon]|nr:TraB family protein [DPANN group archaeon]
MFKNMKIIGTSHISKDSFKKIKNSIKTFKPDVVAVELDKKRYHSLIFQKESKLSFLDVRRVGLTGFLFLIIGKYVQKKLGSIVGIDPGSDMKLAIELCKENNLSLELIDRDIEVTLRRFSQKFSFKEKLNLLKDLLFFPFSKKIIPFNISKIPKKGLIRKILEEIKTRYPNIYSVLIEERNKYMAKKLFKILRDNKNLKILCVIGAGHEEGLHQELKNLYYSNLSF